MSISHDLAGLTHEGGHDRPLASAGWAVPAVQLRGDSLAWSYRNATEGEVKPRMLDRFLRLADAPPERIARYATDFGILTASVPLGAMEGREPLEWWRTLATEATAVLDISAAARNRRAAITESDWARFRTLTVAPSAIDGRWWNYGAERYGPLGLESGGVLDTEQLLSLYVTGWLSNVSVGLAWSNARESELYLAARGLLGALGLQLAQSLARTAGLALTCRGCAKSFSPTRGNQRYCQPCRDLKEPQQRATKAYRRRSRE